MNTEGYNEARELLAAASRDPRQRKEAAEMNRPTYQQYRSYGHGPITAFTLSTDPIAWFVAAAIIGLTGGLLI